MGIIMVHMSVKQSTKKFGADWTTKSCVAVIKQIHMRKTFVPKHRHELTPKQQERMVEAFIFLTEKRSGEIKARKVLGGNVQLDYISKAIVPMDTAGVIDRAGLIKFIMSAVDPVLAEMLVRDPGPAAAGQGAGQRGRAG
jgi:hypothetical protein